MNRKQIIAAHPLPEFLRSRGHELKQRGENFETNACPSGAHQKKGHRPVTIDVAEQLWHCNDHDVGGTVIDWVMTEKHIGVGEAMRQLSGGPNGANPPRTLGRIIATYDYVDETGNFLFQKVRFHPKKFRQRRPDGKGGWIWDLEGVPRVLYHADEVARAQLVIIVEGEKDADNVRELGFTATTNPMGAGKWRKEYAETLRGKDVIVFGDVGDADGAGEKHTAKVLESLNGKARSLKHAKQPDRFHDISDYIESLKREGESRERIAQTIAQLIEATPFYEAKPAVAEQPRIAKVDPPQTPMTIVEWRETIDENFPALTRPAEVCGSVPTQLLINDVTNPCALGLLDVPSSGKTITLNFFDVPLLSYTTDHFTPSALVSNATNVKREELGNVDMLPRIRYKTLIVRDLAPIFGAREDALLEMVGRMTRALDGEGLETDSGVHGQRGYKGDYVFMMLAGSTPLPPRVYKVLGTLGSRLFFLQLHSTTKNHDQLIAQNRGKDRRDKERLCREATDLLLRTLWAANPNGVDWNKAADPEDCLLVIARCAELLASLRGTIQVWRSDNDDSICHSIPVIEQPDRINCLLYNLARGHALLCGRRQITKEDLWPILEVTFDSALTSRSTLFRHLVERDGKLETPEVEKLLKCTAPTARNEMEALSVLGLVDKLEITGHATIITLATRFEWFTSEECTSLMEPHSRLASLWSYQADRDLDDRIDQDVLRERITDEPID